MPQRTGLVARADEAGESASATGSRLTNAPALAACRRLDPETPFEQPLELAEVLHNNIGEIGRAHV